MADAYREIPNARREHSDIAERFVWSAAAALLFLLLACGALVFWLYPQSVRNDTLQPPLPLYPEPRLQPRPAADMRAFHAQEMRQLNGTGWVDKDQGIVHIPIDDAMRAVAHDGVPGWPVTAVP